MSATTQADAGEATGLCRDPALSLCPATDTSAYCLCRQWTCARDHQHLLKIKDASGPRGAIRPRSGDRLALFPDQTGLPGRVPDSRGPLWEQVGTPGFTSQEGVPRHHSRMGTGRVQPWRATQGQG